MLPLRLLGQRRFAGAQIAVFAIAASFFAVFLYMTLYLQTVLGMSPIETGLVYLPGTFLVFVVSGMTAQIGARYSAAKIASVGLALVAAGLALMLLCKVDSSWTILLPACWSPAWAPACSTRPGARSPSTRCPTSRAAWPPGPTTPSARPESRSGSQRSGPLVPADAALGGNLQSYVDGLHHALIVAAAIAAVGATATAWLLLPARARAEAEADAVTEAA